jgi:hypothetical protein
MSCLQQGRSFFEIAELSSLEIKPLIVFYGMMGFARAMIMARTFHNIETLPKKHGLSDVSPETATLESLTLKVTSNGTFHLMNDSINSLEKFIVHNNSDINYVRQSTTKSQALNNKTLTLKDILSRIKGIEKHYLGTFKENANVVGCSHFTGGKMEARQIFSFQVFIDNTFKTKQDLLRIVSDLRNRFSFLKNWSVESASCAGGFTSIGFTNQKYHGQEPENNSDVLSVESIDSYGCRFYHDGTPVTEDDILSKTAPIAGGLSSDLDTHIIEPFDGLYISEITLHYMGMFLLSSLVRYRPDIWSNAISRRTASNKPVDDKALSLIEHFIEISLGNFPQFVVSVIKEPFRENT